MAWQTLFGELATTKIAAIFENEAAAASAAAALHSTTDLQATQLRLVRPHEKDYSNKLEPESHGIARTALRAHLILGVAGAVLGIAAWGLVYAMDMHVIVSSPQACAGALIFFADFGGSNVGGRVL